MRDTGPDSICTLKDFTRCSTVTKTECMDAAGPEIETCLKETDEPATIDVVTTREWGRAIGKCATRRLVTGLKERGQWRSECNAPRTQ
jgi:hypothetical protein